MPVRTKRVYEAADPQDGRRVLVDRLWPRGLTKDKANLDAWIRSIAPSDALRKWFGHDPELWEQFLVRYAEELDGNPEAVSQLRAELDQGPATLLFGARDEQHNNAVALAWYLDRDR